MVPREAMRIRKLRRTSLLSFAVLLGSALWGAFTPAASSTAAARLRCQPAILSIDWEDLSWPKLGILFILVCVLLLFLMWFGMLLWQRYFRKRRRESGVEEKGGKSGEGLRVSPHLPPVAGGSCG